MEELKPDLVMASHIVTSLWDVIQRANTVLPSITHLVNSVLNHRAALSYLLER